MTSGLRAIEVDGEIGTDHRLHVSTPLNLEGPRRVRVIVLYGAEDSTEGEIDEQVWLRAASTNPAFEFLNDSAEDVYSPADGEPYCGEA